MGIPAATLEKTFKVYSGQATAQKDPSGKKLFQNADFRMDDYFNVDIMTPVFHYTMDSLEIDPESRVLAPGNKSIPGLFAAGEVTGGVHGANRLGGSSLLGCVVFGRVSGDSASSYLLQRLGPLAEKAAGRLGAVAGHLGAEPSKVRLHPSILCRQITNGLSSVIRLHHRRPPPSS